MPPNIQPLWARHAGNALTALRIAVAPMYVACVLAQTAPLGWLAGVLFALAAASDVYDGRLARRYGSASTFGRFLDHFADIGFLLAAYAAFAARGEAPWWVPASIAAAFAVYVVDSWLRSAPAQPNLIGSRIGHAGGVANYVLLGVLTFNAAAELRLLPPSVVLAMCALVPTYSAAAILSRFLPAASSPSRPSRP